MAQTGNIAWRRTLAPRSLPAEAVEHYEITRYGTLIAWAQQLGRTDMANLFKQTLAEEKAADQKLTTMAEGTINLRAAS